MRSPPWQILQPRSQTLLGIQGPNLHPDQRDQWKVLGGKRAQVSVPGAGTVVREILAGDRCHPENVSLGGEKGQGRSIREAQAIQGLPLKISGTLSRVSKCLVRHCTGGNLFVTSARDKCRSHCRLGRDSKSSLSWECGPATEKAKVLPGGHWEWGDTCCT